MAATIERAKADDPRELRKQIADLKAQKAKLEQEVTKAAARPAPAGKTKDVPALTDADRELLDRQRLDLFGTRDALMATEEKLLARIVERAHAEIESVAGTLRTEIERRRKEFAEQLEGKRFQSIIEKLGRVSATPAPVQRRGEQPRTVARAAVPRQVPTARKPGHTNGSAAHAMEPRQLKILNVLANAPDGLQSGRLAILSGRTWSGGMRNDLALLRTLGYVEGANTSVMRLTSEGRAALGDQFEPLPTGPELAQHWLSSPLFEPRQHEILRVLLAHPGGLDKDGLSDAIGREWSGGVRNDLAVLRTAGVIVGKNTEIMRASDELFE